jgi:hypothetical protein
MIRITWRQYWDELRSAWIVDFHRDLIRYWLKKIKETDWVEILLFVLTPAICLATWITIPISYPLLTYIKLSMAEEKE